MDCDPRGEGSTAFFFSTSASRESSADPRLRVRNSRDPSDHGAESLYKQGAVTSWHGEAMRGPLSLPPISIQPPKCRSWAASRLSVATHSFVSEPRFAPLDFAAFFIVLVRFFLANQSLHPGHQAVLVRPIPRDRRIEVSA